ncbi:MAG: FAD-binding oxidoreductase [Alistipes sp.]|nr:FAD-binding oxidoreductase [Alistipes sp.]
MDRRYSEFVRRIGRFVDGERIYTDELRRFAWGTDAGFYRLTPQVVVRAKNEAEVSQLLAVASEIHLPVTFRAAGTSLSGQAISDSILVVAGKHWERYSVGEGGETITLQPGIVGAEVNRILAPYGRKFGPDPASIKSAMVGGIVMNNASGMCCGVWANSDRVLLSARLVFADGAVLDTADKASREAFAASHKGLIDEICAIRDEVRADEELTERIRRKYTIKCVTGLNLLPFVLYDDPFDIILHSVVGSEGTLCFVSEVTMRTLPLLPLHRTAMVYFKTIREACEAVVAIKSLGVSAVELLDKRSLTAAGDTTGEGLTALLIELEEVEQSAIDEKVARVTAELEKFDTVTGVHFTAEEKERAKYWAVRSGIFPMVGGLRKEGTTCMIEDIAFHIEDLPQATEDLSALLDRCGYDDSCIYGHALEGNYHFIINQSLSTAEEVARYHRLIEELAELVVDRYDGSLKAEHGTGRNMAPFVEREWGAKAFEMMRRVKRAFDGENLLNPGVIFNDDKECYLKNFKQLPILHPADDASEEVREMYKQLNRCIECGFCEVNCVSCGYTLSSRTRMVLQREIARLEASGEDAERLALLKKGYTHYGNDTCAGDGLCSKSCPMGINISHLTHELRRLEMGAMGNRVGGFVANHFAGVKGALRGVLAVADVAHSVLGSKAMSAIGKGLHKGLKMPLWTPSLPKNYRFKEGKVVRSEHKDKVVYFPSCINQTMGVDKKSRHLRPLVEEMMALFEKAGYEVILPKAMDSLCCGTIWESKGMPELADKKLRELEDALWEASEQGKYDVVCDQSPCLYRMKEKISKLHLYDSAEFVWKKMRDRLEFKQGDTPIAIHLTCSTRKMGIEEAVVGLANLCSSKVLLPEGVGCCGFAGDKGMSHPELNAYALRKLREQIEKNGIEVGYSNSRTCEIGLTTNSGVPYRSIIYLVNECTK